MHGFSTESIPNDIILLFFIDKIITIIHSSYSNIVAGCWCCQQSDNKNSWKIYIYFAEEHTSWKNDLCVQSLQSLKKKITWFVVLISIGDYEHAH